MGFWSSFFGTGAAHAVNETRKETKKHNDMCYELSDCKTELNNYLRRVGCSAIYIPSYGAIDSGSISSEIRKMNTIRKKVEEYIELGGDPSCIQYVDEIYEVEEWIKRVKYLKSKNILDRQLEFKNYKNIETIESTLESERIIQEHEELVKKREREEELLKIVGTDINSMTGIEFEVVCQKLVENMGFETETTKASGDGGIDIVAYNHQPLLSGKYIIQCKRYAGSVGEPIIRDLYGVVMSERANKGILMTTGYFTKSAESFAEGKPIELIDGVAMQNLFLQYGLTESVTVAKTPDNKVHVSDRIEIEDSLGAAVKELYNDFWNDFETKMSEFNACLSDLVTISNLTEKFESIESVIFALKTYEAVMMVANVEADSNTHKKLFKKIINVMGADDNIDAETLYLNVIFNEDGLADLTKSAAVPTGDNAVGLLWLMLIDASDEIENYSYLNNLLDFHSKYILALGSAMQCLTDEDILDNITINYFSGTNRIIGQYIDNR